VPGKQSPEDFWREYEEKTGERVLARGLGQYVCGWREFDRYRGKPIWGLVMATTGGFRFHHFPQAGGFLGALTSTGNAPQEKTIFVPGDRIASAVFHRETKWYKKLFATDSPFLRISYLDESDDEKELRFSSIHQTGSDENDIAAELMANRQWGSPQHE